jgi:hypothetical protein
MPAVVLLVENYSLVLAPGIGVTCDEDKVAVADFIINSNNQQKISLSYWLSFLVLFCYCIKPFVFR